MPPALLLGCQAVSKAYGSRPLFEGLSFGLFEGDHVGLVGPNGSGKSTLLKILAGIEAPDTGSRSVRGGVRVGVRRAGPGVPRPAAPSRTRWAGAGGGRREPTRPARIALALGRAGLRRRARRRSHTLSGGWRKRLAIARELAGRARRAPDGRADQPPRRGRHPLARGACWPTEARAFLVVSHDRYFLEHVATRMLELSRAYPGGLFESDGPYSEFLVRRDEFLRGQAAYEESLANTVRREIEWLRRGAKARSTKAKGRIKEADRLPAGARRGAARAAPAAPRRSSSPPPAGARGSCSSRTGSRRRSAAACCSTASTSPSRAGTRVGLIGPNGSGKTTLLGVLAGERWRPTPARSSAPTASAIVRFEQDRRGLDPDQSLRRALAPEGDAVIWQGRTIHVASWAKRFLFRPEQLEVPVGRLSGGEQARILIARLMLRARGPPDPRRADERPRHPDARGAGGEPRRVRGGPRARDPRPLHARAGVDHRPGPRRRRAAPRHSPTTPSGQPRAPRASARRALSPWRRRPRRRRAARAGARASEAPRLPGAARVGRHGARDPGRGDARSRRAGARRKTPRSPPIPRRCRTATPRSTPPAPPWSTSTPAGPSSKPSRHNCPQGDQRRRGKHGPSALSGARCVAPRASRSARLREDASPGVPSNRRSPPAPPGGGSEGAVEAPPI